VWNMTHPYMCDTWLIHTCVEHDSSIHLWHMTHPYMCETWLIHTCVKHDSSIHVWHMTHPYMCGASVCGSPWSISPDMTHDSFICVRHDSFMCVTWLTVHVRHIGMWQSFINFAWYDSWLIHMCDMTHSYVWHDSSIHAWHIGMWQSFICFADMTHDSFVCAWHDWFICVKRLIHVCAMTNLAQVEALGVHNSGMPHPYVWFDSASMCVIRLIYLSTHVWHYTIVTHSRVWHDSYMCMTRLIRMCDMTHTCVWHDSYACVTWLIHVCDMIRDTCVCVTWSFNRGWGAKSVWGGFG